MTISIDWNSRVITVPREDMPLVQSSPTEIRSLDLDSFRLELKDLEDDVEGIAYPDTHNHIAPIQIGNTTLARVVEIINGFTVTFEDGQYAVDLGGANSNIRDKINRNQVSVNSDNTAGLIQGAEVDLGNMEVNILSKIEDIISHIWASA